MTLGRALSGDWQLGRLHLILQIILSWILSVMGSRGQGYRNCRKMAMKMVVQQLCKEEEVGFVGMFLGEG